MAVHTGPSPSCGRSGCRNCDLVCPHRSRDSDLVRACAGVGRADAGVAPEPRRAAHRAAGAGARTVLARCCLPRHRAVRSRQCPLPVAVAPSPCCHASFSLSACRLFSFCRRALSAACFLSTQLPSLVTERLRSMPGDPLWWRHAVMLCCFGLLRACACQATGAWVRRGDWCMGKKSCFSEAWALPDQADAGARCGARGAGGRAGGRARKRRAGERQARRRRRRRGRGARQAGARARLIWRMRSLAALTPTRGVDTRTFGINLVSIN